MRERPGIPILPAAAGDCAGAEPFALMVLGDAMAPEFVEGEVIQSFNGGLSEFNGLTEIGFPRTFIEATDRDTPPYVNRALIPAPVLFDVSWFGPLSTAAGRISLQQ